MPLVDLHRDQAAHGRLRTVVGVDVERGCGIRNEAAFGDRFGDLHRIREREVAVVETVHEGREVGVPIEQHVAAPVGAPAAAYRRDGSVVLGIVGQVPPENGLHRRENVACVATRIGPALLTQALLF